MPSVVYIDGHVLEAIFIDNETLRGTIPQSAMVQAGYLALTVKNPEPSGGVSSSHRIQVINPRPVITSVHPAEASAGNPVTLTIYGRGFFEDTVVTFGGISKPAIVYDRTKIQIELSAAELGAAGPRDVVVANGPPGGGDSNAFVFTVKETIQLTVTAPAEGSLHRGKTVIVKGNVSGTEDAGILVNGVPADIRGRRMGRSHSADQRSI
ncbi:MAG: IPT/TIG domain-containing protein [Candidatus Moduliflexus flocculans]|nr:IPT/TIG domain-containing protein [Candidatus Moduliflexus flocculans]